MEPNLDFLCTEEMMPWCGMPLHGGWQKAIVHCTGCIQTASSYDMAPKTLFLRTEL